MGFGKTLETDWVDPGTEMELGPGLGLVGAHAGGVWLHLLHLHGEDVVGLEGWRAVMVQEGEANLYL